MSIIADIKQKAEQYDKLNVEVEGDLVSVSANSNDSFVVWAQDHGDNYTIGYEGWHEEFTSKEEALNCFAF
ncbi:MAG: hypothetical protein O7D86_00245 [Proteobacteria bacterium]|nr:hypothetical protein [Pseudomonadota bacterium]